MDCDLKISDIAEALGVSRSIIKRRLREYGISISERQTDVPDAELDSVVRKIQTQFPKCWIQRNAVTANVTRCKCFSNESSCINAEDGSRTGGNEVVLSYPKSSVPCKWPSGPYRT